MWALGLESTDHGLWTQEARMEAGDVLDSDNEQEAVMFSDDSDLDALLDAQSSDDDEGDEHVRPGVERTIDDILHDFDEFGLDDLDSAPPTPHSAVQPEENAANDEAVEGTTAQAVREERAGGFTAEDAVEESDLDKTPQPTDNSLAVTKIAQESASVEAFAPDGVGTSFPAPLSKVDVADPESEEISEVTFSPVLRKIVEDGSTSTTSDEAGDVEFEDLDREGRSVDDAASSDLSEDDIEFHQQATWEIDESDITEDESKVTPLSLSSDTAFDGREESTKEVAEDFAYDPGTREQYTALDKAEEFERKAASSGLSFEEGAAAQPMRLEGIQRGPPAIGILQLDSGGSLSHALGTPAMRRDHGYPQALAVHASFIAVGMSKGGVLVTSSKYAPTRHSDTAESKAFFLGGADKLLSAVSAMCFNQQGDMLLVGYSNGSVILWDLTRAAIAKSITAEHTAAVIHSVFLWQDLQAARQMKAITGDCKGLVLLHTFTTVPLLRRVSLTTQCLLDGQRNGIALSVTPMLPSEGSPTNGISISGLSANSLGLNTMMGGVAGVVGGVSDVGRKYLYDTSAVDEGGGLVVFVTQQTSLVVRLIPALEVCAKFPRPQGVSESAVPYTAWRRRKPASSNSTQPSQAAGGLPNGSSNDLPPNSEASGSAAEILEGGKASSKNTEVEVLPVLAMAWDKKVFVMQLFKSELQVTAEWDLDSMAAGVAWLEEQMLVILTLDSQLCLFTKDGFEVERASLGGDEAVTYLSYFVNQFGNPEKMYNSSLAVRGAAVYVLGPSQLWRTCLLPWQDRIKALQDAGDWMGAFHIAMELYDGKARGVTGLPRGLEARQDAIMPTLLSLLSAYVDEAFAYLSLAYSSHSTPTLSDEAGLNLRLAGSHETESLATVNPIADDSELEVKDQYARVGGVAIEFCVHIEKTDVLFESVFNKFDAVGQQGIFLELLEPYILRDMLGGLAPEVMQALVEHYSRKGWLQRVEQCILHMDIASLDFNQVVRLCRENGLYSALIYLFNKGLDDFKSPLEELLVVAQDPQTPQCESFGYKLLVYLKYSFLGLSFPPGHGVLPPARLPSLRVELLQFLLDPVGNEEDQAVRKSRVGQGKTFPRLCYLLELDTKATLLVFSLAFPEDGPLGVGRLGCAYSGIHDLQTPEAEIDQGVAEATTYMQAVVNALVHVMEAAQHGFSGTNEGLPVDSKEYQSWPTEEDASCILRFVARFVAARHAVVASNTLSAILENLTTVTESTRVDLQALVEKETVMLELLQGLPATEWNASVTLQRAQQARFWQVTAFIHTKDGNMTAALDSYLLDVRQPQQVFVFIMSMLDPENGLKHIQLLSFRDAVLDRIPNLLTLSRQRTLAVVLEHFNKDNDGILTRLAKDRYLLFSYLKALMDVRTYGFCHPLPECHEQGSEPSQRIKEDQICAVGKEINLAELLQQSELQFTDEMAELYVELLCQFDPKSVLRFLESYENYRLEHCLRLCQEYEVTDAAVFILERVGDVASALSLVLADVEPRLHQLEEGVVKLFASPLASGYSSKMFEDDPPEVHAVTSVLRDAVSLCQRNTLRLDPLESELLWFRLLDRFVDPLCDLNFSDNILSPDRSQRTSFHQHGKGTFQWNISASKRAREFIRRKLTQLMGEIVDGMMGFVPLQDIMEKILTDHGKHEFGDFRGTILGMLSTYGFECALLGTAKQLIEDDTYTNISALKKHLAQAHAPRGSTCCICDLDLSETHMMAPGRTLNVPGKTEGSGSDEKLKGKAADEESITPLTAIESPGVYVFACGHAAHSTCLENSPQWGSSFAGCPVCSLQNPTKESPSISQAPLLRKQHVQQSRPLNGRSKQWMAANGGSSPTVTELPLRSRWELLNSLERGKGIDEFGPSLQLTLSPPRVSRKQPSSSPHKNRSSALSQSSGRRHVAPLAARRTQGRLRGHLPQQ